MVQGARLISEVGSQLRIFLVLVIDLLESRKHKDQDDEDGDE